MIFNKKDRSILGGDLKVKHTRLTMSRGQKQPTRTHTDSLRIYVYHYSHSNSFFYNASVLKIVKRPNDYVVYQMFVHIGKQFSTKHNFFGQRSKNLLEIFH